MNKIIHVHSQHNSFCISKINSKSPANMPQPYRDVSDVILSPGNVLYRVINLVAIESNPFAYCRQDSSSDP